MSSLHEQGSLYEIVRICTCVRQIHVQMTSVLVFEFTVNIADTYETTSSSLKVRDFLLLCMISGLSS